METIGVRLGQANLAGVFPEHHVRLCAAVLGAGQEVPDFMQGGDAERLVCLVLGETDLPKQVLSFPDGRGEFTGRDCHLARGTKRERYEPVGNVAPFLDGRKHKFGVLDGEGFDTDGRVWIAIGFRAAAAPRNSEQKHSEKRPAH